ncbi:MAG: C25 family cysteine peptidase [Pirellulales bacterium]
MATQGRRFKSQEERKDRSACLARPWHPAVLLAALAVAGGLARAADAPAANRGLVIVAPRQFEDALKPFAEYKRQSLPVECVALETILAENQGADDPERLKHSLYRAWRERKARYVLLVGDADVLPVRYMVLDRVTPPAFDYAFYPSDLYYADVAKADGAFEDWNAVRDGFHAAYYGEVRGEKNKSDPINFDRIDYRPELAVGRWPASTPEEVTRLAAKSMAYEKRTAAGKLEAPRADFICVGGWVDARDAMDRVADSLPKKWKIEKRYFSDRRRKSETPPPNEAEVERLLNGGAELIVHAGHGSDMGWEQCFSVRRLDRIKNADSLPVIISAGCSTARFATLPPYEPYVDVAGGEHKGSDKGEVFREPPPPPAVYQKGRFNPPGMGELLLRSGPNGAVAYIGCNTGSQPCGLTLVEGFGQAWGRAAEPRLGDCWAEAVRYYYDRERLADLKPTPDWYPPSIFFQGMKFMLFGDPSLRLP